MSVSAVLVAVSPVASTSTFDLLAWTVATCLVVRALCDDGPGWLLVGLAAGTSLEIKTPPAFLLLSLRVGVVTVGPRQVLTSRWLWAGAGVAHVTWAPNLARQATHGWPQLTLSSSIASG